MKKALAAIKDAYARENNITVWLEAYQEASVAYSKRIRLAEQRTKAIVTLLTKEYGIPEASIKSGRGKGLRRMQRSRQWCGHLKTNLSSQ